MPSSPLSADSCLTLSMWNSCETRQGSLGQGMQMDGSGRWAAWMAGESGGRGLFEQVNLGMIGVPPVYERAREYIDLCLIKNGGARHVIP